jgi:hypothetical protein
MASIAPANAEKDLVDYVARAESGRLEPTEEVEARPL